MSTLTGSGYVREATPHRDKSKENSSAATAGLKYSLQAFIPSLLYDCTSTERGRAEVQRLEVNRKLQNFQRQAVFNA